MFATFFHELKAAKVPVTLKEYLTLMEALQANLADRNVEYFYYLSRAALVKDERHLDKFDQVFGHVFKGLDLMADAVETQVPEEWLRSLAQLYLTEEEKAKIEALGGWEKIMEELKKRLEEQKGRHQGGKKWIGTGGTSPYGADGYNPAGVRIGQKTNRNNRAIKVWDKREYRDLDDKVELGTRNIKVALRRLRKFAREGPPDELDLDTTIKGTAHKGYLDIHMRPERRNTVKVLMFFDIGGSMDWHIKTAEELFSAARTEFKHLEYFYFHNCLYEFVWKDNAPPLDRAGPNLAGAAQVPGRLQGDLRRRCLHEPLRDLGGRRLGGAHERGAGRAVDAARHRHLRALRVAEPGAREPLGLDALHQADARPGGRAHVSAHPRRPGPGHEGADAVADRDPRFSIISAQHAIDAARFLGKLAGTGEGMNGFARGFRAWLLLAAAAGLAACSSGASGLITGSTQVVDTDAPGGITNESPLARPIGGGVDVGARQALRLLLRCSKSSGPRIWLSRPGSRTASSSPNLRRPTTRPSR